MHYRRILRLFLIPIVSFLAIVVICLLYGFFIEVRWLKIKTINISDTPSIRLIHISDIHYKGDKTYLKRLVSQINDIPADIVCFTGDLIEAGDIHFLPECLDIILSINKPLYGVGGNHDTWAVGERLNQVETCFERTGGKWFSNNMVISFDNGKGTLVGESLDDVSKSNTQVLLNHYPTAVERITEDSFDLVLAGHTHGGQINIPFFKINNKSKYQRGLYKHNEAYLHVTPGIGTYFINARFLCRPEISVIAM